MRRLLVVARTMAGAQNAFTCLGDLQDLFSDGWPAAARAPRTTTADSTVDWLWRDAWRVAQTRTVVR
ncbi:hypothetical protein DBP20_32455 [Streptomyces sp. CS131]|nr:hypothetical protein DBP20_32455 [Streptomyces sp. CS131]